MAFDLSTAKPVSGGFDLSTASPVGEEQERPAFDKAAYYRELNETLNPIEKFMVGVGRGMTTIGRATGLADPEPQQATQAFSDLSENSKAAWAGEIVGEAAPFALLGPAGGTGMKVGSRVLIPAAEKLLTRIGLGTAIGATEGAAIVRGKGGDAGETMLGGGVGGTIGGAVEALMPVVGRLGRAVFSRLKRKPKGPLISAGGDPTQELLSALDEAGMTFDDLTDQAIDYIAENQSRIANPQEAVRKARFDELGIPATKGDISQDFAQQASEQRLMSMAADAHGEPLRQYKLDQSNILVAKINEMVDGLGLPGRAGETVKKALTGRKRLLTKQKNKLYKDVFETAPNVKSLPIMTDSVIDAIPEKDILDDIAITAPEALANFKVALARFGLDTSDEALDLLQKRGIEPQPLTVGNFERFRKTVNALERTDQTGAVKVVTTPIKQALDGELDLIGKALDDVGFTEGNVVQTLKEARKIVRTTKTEFSPQSITGRLIDVKRDGVTPVIEASKVVRELYTKPLEHIDRTIKSLQKSGKKGRKAIGDLRASVVMNALEDALKAPSRKTSGLETLGGNQFYKSLKKFGDDKLEVLFRGDAQALKMLKKLEQTALDITPAAAATPKGSAPVIMDLMSRMGRSPVVGEFVNLAKFMLKGGSEDRAVAKAIRARPDFKRTAMILEAEFPALAAAIGVTGVMEEVQKEDE